MQKIYYILPLILLLYTSCNGDADIPADAGKDKVVLKIMQQSGFTTKAIDGDNLAVEQTVKNLSIFFTEPSANTISNKYVFAGFSAMGDYQIVTLPLDAATVNSKDIYVIANYDNEAALNAAATINDLEALKTPVIDKTNNLAPEKGFCMYGNTLNFNFNDGTNSPAIVNMKRSVAKFRITVTFPENPLLSTKNSFLIQNAATYTNVVGSETLPSIPVDDLFTYAAPIALNNNGAGAFVNNTYVYESSQAPSIYIYTYMNNSAQQQEFSATLPKPVRNHLYDISIQIYSGDVPSGTRSFSGDEKDRKYAIKSTVTVYDENGNIETY